MKLQYLLLLIGALLFTAGCDHKYKAVPKNETVAVFRAHAKPMLAEANPSNNWSYAYIITDNKNHYYKATSKERTKDYRSLQWTRVVANTLKEVLEAIPDMEFDADLSSPFESDVVPTMDLGSAFNMIVFDSPVISSGDSVGGDSFSVDTGSSMGGDSIGGDTGGGDTGGGDTGGGDSGGGDSGGGDSGGGGDGGGGDGGGGGE